MFCLQEKSLDSKVELFEKWYNPQIIPWKTLWTRIWHSDFTFLEIDEDGSGEIEFGEFCQLCAKFLVEEPDEETMKAELKEAFRVYDKEGQGFRIALATLDVFD